MLEAKILENIGFQENGKLVEALDKQAQPTRVPPNQLPLLGRGLVDRCKKHPISSSSLSFPIEEFFFPVEVQSRVTITCQALNAQTTSESSTLSSTDWGCFLVFWLSRLETYILRAPLHLWVREHLHLFIYLLVLAIKVVILFLVHQIIICIFFSAPLWFILVLELYLSHY